MCGIAGYHGLHADTALLERMNACQQHRGPDGDGIVTDGPCGLAHRRLSIIDVAHGQQPMDTADGRYSIAYNGEVYNYLDLRAELQALGRTFATDSDTEVVLQAFAQWGPDAFDRFNGMFGLAIWDRHEQRLTLARDHFGIKPVYVARVANPSGDGEVLLFSSEIKPILASGLYDKKVNDRSVYRYLRFRAHEDGTETFFDGIERLAPGEMLTVDADGIHRRMFTRLKEELLELASVQRPYDDAAAAEYKRRLVESVRLRLQSEVPVGTSLSGGLDSSAVAVIINQLLNEGDELSTRSVGTRQNTFSAVFPGSINDEERYVDDVLDICTGHVDAHKILPTADEFKADLLDFVRTQEEPLISSGPYAQFQVMREATKHVTVLLDGQGADEMMAGYIPYYFVYLRQLRARGATLAAAELAKSLDVLYRLGRFKLKAKVKLKKTIPTTQLLNRDFVAAHTGERYSSEGANLKKRLVEDLFHNSLPSLLRYEDKNTMRFSLEGRVPFLDKEVLKFVFSLSDEAIIKDGWNKRVLRDATRGLLPESINRRRNKIGFTTPQVEWFMRLKNHFYNIFLSESFANRPYVDQTSVVNAFEGWIKGTNDVDTMTFWRLINLELWLREFFDDRDEDAEAAAVAKAAHVKTDVSRTPDAASTSSPPSGTTCAATPCAPSCSAATTTSTPACSPTSTASSPACRRPARSTRPRPVARGGSSCPRRSSRSPRDGPTSCGTSRSAARHACSRATSRGPRPASAWAARSRCSSPSRRPACPASSTPRPVVPSARRSAARGCSTSSSATTSTRSTDPPSTAPTRRTCPPSSPPRTRMPSRRGCPRRSATGCPSRGARPSAGP